MMSAMLQPPSLAVDHSASRAGIAKRARAYGPAARRFVVIAAIAWWLGGFTFYAGVAVPVGMEVLGSHKIVGFVTQRVTNWLNVGGVIALAVLLWNVVLSQKGRVGRLRSTLWATWILMAAIQVELIVVHPTMDRLLAPRPTRMILDEGRFDSLHRVYLISSSIQWAIGLLHVWCICLAWSPAETITQQERIDT